MKQLASNRSVIVALLFAISLGTLSTITYQKAKKVCTPASGTERPASTVEVFWDSFSSQLISVSAR